MDLAFDAKRAFCNYTGLGNYSRTLIKNLAIAFPEHNYHLFTPKVVRNDKTNWFTNHHSISIHTPLGAILPAWRSFAMSKSLQRNKPDIFHGLSHELPFGIKKTGIKTVVTIHDLIFKHYPETYPLFDRTIYNIKFRHACYNADRIIAISESTKNDIIKFYGIDPLKIEVIYQACNPVYYTLKSPEVVESIKAQYALPNDYLLFVGTIEKRKNLQTVIKALGLLPENMKLPLVVVGKGKTYKQDCMKLALKLRLSTQIIWFDNLQSNEHLQAFYQGARALLYPSFFEGFGLPVAEALLSNTPVITSKTSSLPEAGGPGSLYVDPLDPDDLQEKIITVLTDSEMHKKMISTGRGYALENFSPSAISKKIMDLYLQLIR